MATLRKKKGAPSTDGYAADVLRAASLAANKKAKDIKAYDVRGLTLIADAFVLCTATSEPQMKAVYHSIKEGLREAGRTLAHSEGEFGGGWLLMDFGSVIVHIFREQAREFYDLDGLWGDAPEIPLDLD